MATFIRRSQMVTDVSHQLYFEYLDTPGAGMAFPCTPEGKVLELNPIARTNYRKCLSNTHEREVICRGVIASTSRYRLPGAIRCDECGQELELADPMTNECRCGAFYNGGGQRLCHPRLWGEETGERFDDHGALIY